MIGLRHPLWLAALALAAWPAWSLLRLKKPPGGAPFVGPVRATLVAAVVLALAGLELRLRPREVTTVFLLDRSMSVSADESARAWTWLTGALERAAGAEAAGVVAFGADAAVEAVPRPGLRLKALESVVKREGTDISAALRLGAALMPAGGAGRIVLLSDGLETDGDMVAEGISLREAGIPVDVVPLSSLISLDAIVERLDAPADVAPKESFQIRASVWASTAMVATARLFRDQELLDAREASLPAGDSSMAFEARLQEPGFHVYRVYLDSPLDLRPQNNSAAAAVEVRGPPAVLVVEGTPGRSRGLGQGLRAAGMRVKTVPKGGLPRSLPELEPFSAIILDNVPSYVLSRRAHAEVRSYVGDLGGGLAMFGGDHAFGAGGYQGSPIEEALPVSMDVKRPEVQKSLAIAIVIDRSGSMAEAPFGVQKIRLAAEGAMRVVEMLGPQQMFGVCAVDTRPDWIVPLAPASEKGGAVQRLGGLGAGGGGILTYDGLQAAFDALGLLTAKTRHVVLFADAADAEQHEKDGRAAVDLVAEMASAGITVSVIGLGRPTDGDAEFLEQCAAAGQGRFYLTEDVESLPSIFLREGTMAREAAVIEEAFVPQVKTDLDPLKGIEWEKVPQLKGYVPTEAKETAQVGLVTHLGDPLLAGWRFGLGRSLAFTSESRGPWSEEWARWPGAGKLWTQSVRWIMRETGPQSLALRAEYRSDRVRVIAETADPEGTPLNFMELEGKVIDPDLRNTALSFVQTGPGLYEASAPAGAEGVYVIRVQASRGEEKTSRIASFIVPYAPEFRHHGADMARLSRLVETTGGRWGPSVGEAFERLDTAKRRLVDLAPWLLLIAGVLLPLEIALRRMRWRPETWQRASKVAKALWEGAAEKAGVLAGVAPAGAPGGARPQALSSSAPESSWDRLKEAKRRAKKRR